MTERIGKVERWIKARVRRARWWMLQWHMRMGLRQLNAMHPYQDSWESASIVVGPEGIRGFTISLKPGADIGAVPFVRVCEVEDYSLEPVEHGQRQVH